MKFLLSALALISVSTVGTVRGSEPVQEPIVVLEPFEPSDVDCYKWNDKFSHPEELIAPQFFYPFEMRRGGISGEVVVLVQIDNRGYPRKLKILYATQRLFALDAIRALKKARWNPEPNRFGHSDVWFYYKAVYALH